MLFTITFWRDMTVGDFQQYEWRWLLEIQVEQFESLATSSTVSVSAAWVFFLTSRNKLQVMRYLGFSTKLVCMVNDASIDIQDTGLLQVSSLLNLLGSSFFLREATHIWMHIMLEQLHLHSYVYLSFSKLLATFPKPDPGISHPFPPCENIVYSV